MKAKHRKQLQPTIIKHMTTENQINLSVIRFINDIS